MRANKRLCVLQVTPENPNENHVELFNDKEDCDFYFVTHDEQHNNALKFCPNTKWADTRNILASEVAKKYDYFAFIDYDYVLRPQRSLDALEQILEDLNKFLSEYSLRRKELKEFEEELKEVKNQLTPGIIGEA